MNKKYPTVNFIGNKEKIADWIFDFVPNDVNIFWGTLKYSKTPTNKTKETATQNVASKFIFDFFSLS